MSDKSTKWIFGCGLGCGAIFLIVVIGFISIYFLIKDTVEEAEMINETNELVESRFGVVKDYKPLADGTIGEDRILLFIEIRDSLNKMSVNLKKEIYNMTDQIEEVENKDEEESSFWDVMGIIKGGFGVIPEIMKYYSNRNMLLFRKDMGLGEYTYLYNIVYYSYLKKFPGDGPDINLMEGGSGINISTDNKESLDSKEVKLIRNESTRRKANRLIRIMYSNTLSDIAITPFWKTAFETEIKLLEENLTRLPWEDGLPEEMKKSLLPFEERLNETYDEDMNSVELIDVNQFKDKN